VLPAFWGSVDILVAGRGTANRVLPRGLLPDGAQYFGQRLWASTGSGTPAAFGAAAAAPDRQVILAEGDGSHQIIATQLGSISQQPVAPGETHPSYVGVGVGQKLDTAKWRRERARRYQIPEPRTCRCIRLPLPDDLGPLTQGDGT
jgi:Thiamine pyrophosphate enzyme, C-terminal TPP binding domain